MLQDKIQNIENALLWYEIKLQNADSQELSDYYQKMIDELTLDLKKYLNQQNK